jgi:light-independent protochlorophyllide reductase subunit B
MPFVRTVPIGVGATRDFIREVGTVAGLDVEPFLTRERLGTATMDASQSLLPWYSRSVDATYLTGKRVFVFGDATHVRAAVRIAAEELGFTVVGLGTYSREFARDIRDLGRQHGLEALITDDYLDVEQAVSDAAPELVLGTQMERHIAKRLGIPCAVISTPIHVQDVPARYSPQMGFEGANVIFDTWVHPLMMGLEEHLLQMFREDFEFQDGAVPSHLHSAGHAAAPAPAEPAVEGPAVLAVATPTPTGGVPAPVREAAPEVATELSTEIPVIPRARPADPVAAAPAPAAVPMEATVAAAGPAVWLPAAEAELRKIPFFVRGKAKRNTERYAALHGVGEITVDTLYEAKAHFGR